MNDGVLPDINMLVGLFIWHSGTRSNSEMCANINKWFYKVEHKMVLLHHLALNRSRGFPSKYPKDRTEIDETLQFYHDAVMQYYDWTPKEFKLNFLDSPDLRQDISKKFGFDNKQRKLLGLEEVKFKKEKFIKIDTKSSLGKWF